jgi:tetratricopeptide (TPR) repeat protein
MIRKTAIIVNTALVTGMLAAAGCSGKYLVKTYPAGAKVYVRDIQTKENKLVGLSPVTVPEESTLGDVFFVTLEKENFKKKDVLVRVDSGESLTITARLDPLSPEELAEQNNGEGQGQQQQPQDKKKDDKKELEDLKLRVALLENTVGFYKDAMFSARFNGNGQAKFDRDRNDQVVEKLFQAQQATLRKNYDVALKMIDEALQQDEYMSKGWLLKGSIKYLQGDMQGARVAWERTLKIDPYNREAYQFLSKVYNRLGLGELPNKPAAMRYPAAEKEIESRIPGGMKN